MALPILAFLELSAMRPLSHLLLLCLAVSASACAKKKSYGGNGGNTPVGLPESGIDPKAEPSGEEKRGYPDASPWTNSDGTRNLTLGPNLEDCRFDRYGEIAGVASNFEFKPVCSSASFGSLGKEGFGTPGKPFLYEWKVEIADRPGTYLQETPYAQRLFSFSYWGGDERFPVEEGATFDASRSQKGYMRLSLNMPQSEDANTFTQITDWNVVVLKAPKAQGDKIRIRYSVTAKTSFEKELTTSAEIELEMCNQPNTTTHGCTFWHHDGN